jgi:hypothetical protein
LLRSLEIRCTKQKPILARFLDLFKLPGILYITYLSSTKISPCRTHPPVSHARPPLPHLILFPYHYQSLDSNRAPTPGLGSPGLLLLLTRFVRNHSPQSTGCGLFIPSKSQVSQNPTLGRFRQFSVVEQFLTGSRKSSLFYIYRSVQLSPCRILHTSTPLSCTGKGRIKKQIRVGKYGGEHLHLISPRSKVNLLG